MDITPITNSDYDNNNNNYNIFNAKKWEFKESINTISNNIP